MLGAASHDDLARPFDRAQVRDHYACDIVGRKTVLIAPTWAYGEMLGHWGDDSALFEQLLAHIESLGANTVIRMHDTFRYSDEQRAKLAALSRKHSGVVFKYKDEAPDNFIDLQIADVLVTNFSSIANLFYATRRPTVHVNPALGADSELVWRTRTGGKLVEHRGTTRELWKMPPQENGGLLANSFDELLAQVEQALTDPKCCESQAQTFLDKHMLGGDGGNCARIDAAVEALLAS
ncbi:MAG: CDP-glycerol glycerophosphotransferase family protein [Nannocystaceae bacterium]|nr:CDP-glycerol glycerophosphotransferase family protein [Nannocystaceae bacterium]